jgi:hypothetical protein
MYVQSRLEPNVRTTESDDAIDSHVVVVGVPVVMVGHHAHGGELVLVRMR